MEGGASESGPKWKVGGLCPTVNLRTKIMDFTGFDSSRILSLRGVILMSIGDFPESLSQLILVGIILVGRLGIGACPIDDCFVSLNASLFAGLKPRMSGSIREQDNRKCLNSLRGLEGFTRVRANELSAAN